MISVNQALEIHEILINKFGGSNGLRDSGSLESALARPFQIFGDEDLYPDLFTKTAAIGESIIINHPFIDGNKRNWLFSYGGYIAIRKYRNLSA